MVFGWCLGVVGILAVSRWCLRDLAKRSLQESLCRDFAKGPFVEFLYREPVWRYLAEILPRSLTEILLRDLLLES